MDMAGFLNQIERNNPRITTTTMKPGGRVNSRVPSLLSSPLLSSTSKESKSKSSHTTHALAQPPLVYIELLDAIQISREGKKMAGRRKIFGPHAWVLVIMEGKM
jgi:hypothetical protein